MSGEGIGLIAILLAAPALLFVVLYFVLRRRALVTGIVTALAGAAAGAFLASAGSAMATSVDPNEAMMRGAAIGFGASAAVAIVIGVLLRMMRV